MTRQKTSRQIDAIEKERSAEIYKADTLLQKGRFSLTLTEQRIILYTISQIRSTDKVFQEYVLDIKDFYDVCGINELDSYTNIKKIMAELRNKSWWIRMQDPHAPGKECESLVNWFTVLRTHRQTGKFTVMFHPDIMPYLLELARQRDEGKGFFSEYELRYVLPMRSQYSIRIYELLKSYQKNNHSWCFRVDDLKFTLDCQNYKSFNDLRRFVIEPAMKEINKFSDLNIGYQTEKKGRRVDVVTFYMKEKTVDERLEARKTGLTELDGEVHYWDS